MQQEGQDTNGLGIKPTMPNNKNAYNSTTNQLGNYEYHEPIYYSYQIAQNASHNMYETLMSSNAENLYLQDSNNQSNDFLTTQKSNPSNSKQYFPYTQNYQQQYPVMQVNMPYMPYYAVQQDRSMYPSEMNYIGYNNCYQFLNGNNYVDNTTKKVDKDGNDISPLSPMFLPKNNYTDNIKQQNTYLDPSINGISKGDVYKVMGESKEMVRIPVIKTNLAKGMRLSDEEREDLLKFLEKKRELDKMEVVHVDEDTKVEGEKINLKTRKPKKDGVWTDELRQSIELCVCTIPKDETNKMRLNMKQYGRNELISMYIQVHHGEYRKIKQVSSHIQVWKNRLRKEIFYLGKIMKWKNIGNGKVQNKNEDIDKYNKKEILLMELFLKKNTLKSDKEIEDFDKMMKLTYNLLEYGMYRDTDAVIRFEELFVEVSKQLKAGLVEG